MFKNHFKINSIFFFLALMALSLTMAPAASAKSSAMIEAGDLTLREDLQWLIDRGVISFSTSTWPIPLSKLEEALARRKKKGLTRADVDALRMVNFRVAQLRRRTSAGMELSINSDTVPPLGFESSPRAQGGVAGYVQFNRENWAGKLKINGRYDPLTSSQSNVDLDGSYLGAGFAGQVIYAGQLAHWWGPGNQGSLIWSNAAPSIPGIGIQRGSEAPFATRWLSWIGPWGYEVFLGQLQDQTIVPNTRVFNMRLYARPLPGLELGASRFIEWGGSGQDNSLKALGKAFIGRSNNPGSFNNEIAGFDARYSFSLGGNPLAVYAQWIGEDEANLLPSKWLSQLGIEYKHAWKGHRLLWNAEASDTMVDRFFGVKQGKPGIAYNHSQYRDGLYQDGMPIGHPLGGDGRLYSLGLTWVPADYKNYSRYRFRALYADVNQSGGSNNLVFSSPDRYVGGEVSGSWLFRSITLKAGLTALKARRGDNIYGAGVEMEIPFTLR